MRERKTYEVFFRAGKEPLKKQYDIYCESDFEAIQTAIKQMQSLLEYIKRFEEKIVCEYKVTLDNRKVCDLIF